MENEVGGIILCGGKSSRFGSDKGSYKFRNKKMIKYSIDLLKKFTNDMIIAGPEIVKDDTIRYVNDIFPSSGPMGGLHAGLMNSLKPFNIVLACDIPFANVSLIQKLISKKIETDIKIFQTPDNKYHPLLGVYHKNICQDLESHLKTGHHKLTQFIFSQDHEIIRLSENDHLKSFVNLNYLKEAKKYE